VTGKREGLLKIGVAGTVLTCIACFTPAAVMLLGILGLATWTGYLDYFLFPLLGLFVGILAYGAWRRRRAWADRTPMEGTTWRSR
jgi:mercuric ion transport protein